jgi:hypothetical protein
MNYSDYDDQEDLKGRSGGLALRYHLDSSVKGLKDTMKMIFQLRDTRIAYLAVQDQWVIL